MEFDCLPSSNDFLLELSKHQKLPDGTLVWVKDQQKGRGQRGNIWISESGKSLSFSILLYPKKLDVDKQFLLSKVVAIALVDWMNSKGVNAQVKWPNDILVDGKKIAGILIENSIDQSGIKQSVVGIGLNVNQCEFPRGLEHVCSISQILGSELDLKQSLEEICSFLEKWYLKMGKQDEVINSTYQSHLFGMGELKSYEDVNGPFQAKVKGVNALGQLLLEDEQQGERVYQFKEVKYLY